MTIVEIYPGANGAPPIQRIATAPRDLANSTLLLLYCSCSVAEICVAFAAVLVSGVHYSNYHRCLLSYMPNGECLRFTSVHAAVGSIGTTIGVLMRRLSLNICSQAWKRC
jgi:hypothetical protein